MAGAVQTEVLDALAAARERTWALVAHLDAEQRAATWSTLMSPLDWDLGHIAAYEDLWLVHRVGDRPLLRAELASLYDAFETPRAARHDLDFLRGDALAEYLAAVRERSEEVAEERGTGELHELVLRHELQHSETMLQTMALADLLPPWFSGPRPVDGSGLELVDVPAGPATIGARGEGFSYDNERPAHAVELPAFRIARTPVTNATWLTFSEGGGYVRREWWSAEGWAWKQEYDITDHAGARAGDPHAPVVHVSWFEADAFARAQGARLPSEVEWEAATWDQRIEATGHVWEWTASPFGGYPGFVAHPYREYSEVFFGPRYRVLRGGSCATHPRAVTTSFRNWDLPQRRQLFSGVRIAA